MGSSRIGKGVQAVEVGMQTFVEAQLIERVSYDSIKTNRQQSQLKDYPGKTLTAASDASRSRVNPKLVRQKLLKKLNCIEVDAVAETDPETAGSVPQPRERFR